MRTRFGHSGQWQSWVSCPDDLKKSISLFWNKDFDMQILNERFKELPKEIAWNNRKYLFERKSVFSYLWGKYQGIVHTYRWVQRCKDSVFSKMCTGPTQLVSLSSPLNILCSLLSTLKDLFYVFSATISSSPREGEKEIVRDTWSSLGKYTFSHIKSFALYKWSVPDLYPK